MANEMEFYRAWKKTEEENQEDKMMRWDLKT